MDDTAARAEAPQTCAMIAEHLTAELGDDGEFADEAEAALAFYANHRRELEPYREEGELLIHVTPDWTGGTVIFNIVVAAESGEATAEWWGANN